MRAFLSITIVFVLQLNLLQPVLAEQMGIDLASLYSRFSAMAEEKEEEPHTWKSVSEVFKSTQPRFCGIPEFCLGRRLSLAFSDKALNEDHSFSIENPPEIRPVSKFTVPF